MKKYLLAIPFVLASTFGYASAPLGDTGVSISGYVEADLYGRTNNAGENGKATFAPFVEINTVLNVEGKHDVGFADFIWRAASKVSTDGRYDALGQREAWAGLETKVGTLKFGNQFSNLYYNYMDGKYSDKGMSSIFSDFGAHATQYTRALSYFSPSIYGFKLEAQYDLGGYGAVVKDSNGAQTQPSLHAYAYEAVLSYNNFGFNAEVGYYEGRNNGNLDMTADTFGGTRTDQGYALGTEENKASVILAGLGYTYNGFTLYGAYTLNKWEFIANQYQPSALDLENHQFMVRGTYAWDKNAVSLGWQTWTKVVDKKITSGNDEFAPAMSSYNFQYDRQIGKEGTIWEKATAFVQYRYTAQKSTEVNGFVSNYGVDGKVDDKKDSQRILVGLFLPF